MNSEIETYLRFLQKYIFGVARYKKFRKPVGTKVSSSYIMRFMFFPSHAIPHLPVQVALS